MEFDSKIWEKLEYNSKSENIKVRLELTFIGMPRDTTSLGPIWAFIEIRHQIRNKFYVQAVP